MLKQRRSRQFSIKERDADILYSLAPVWMIDYKCGYSIVDFFWRWHWSGKNLHTARRQKHLGIALLMGVVSCLDTTPFTTDSDGYESNSKGN